MGYSFIIPVYNCGQTLAACVESIRAAGLTDYEILLIDDGSSDGSGALCHALAEQYAEIRAFHQAHAGVSAARNRGLQEVRQTHILFVDADDILHGTALSDILEQTGDLVIFGANTALWRRAGELDWRRDFGDLFRENVLSPVWNKVYQTSIIRENTLHFREEMFVYEDLEFVLRYLAHCGTVANVPEEGYCHRPSGGASRRVKALGRISEFLRPLEAALEGLSLPWETVNEVRLGLYTILAREKICLSNRAEIKEISEDFQKWREDSMEFTNFTEKLRRCKTWALWLESRGSVLKQTIRRKP